MTRPDGAIVLRYADTIGLQNGDPSFLIDFLMSPINAFLPRLLFPWKSVYDYGLWCTHHVFNVPSFLLYGSDLSTHGYFYLAGGIGFVIIGYMLMGFLMKFAGEILRIDKPINILCMISFLLIITNELFSTQSPTEMATAILRNIVVYPMMCRILLTKVGGDKLS